MSQVVDFLVGQYMFDMWVLQQWWLWAPLGIPGVAYVLFMCLKWSTFLIPVHAVFNSAVHHIGGSFYKGWKNAAKESI